MPIQAIKTNFHKLIDGLENEPLLKKFYELLKEASEQGTSDFWDELTPAQQHEIDTAWLASEQPENLIPHKQVEKEAKTWLKK